MNKSIKISDSELEVMKIVWDIEPSTSNEIVEILSKNNIWKPKTIQTLIKRLVDKGVLKTEKLTEKKYIYSASISKGEYEKYANSSFVKRVYNGSIKSMISSFIKTENITDEDLEELKSLLKDKE